MGESRLYSKRAKKSPFAGFVPQSGITVISISQAIYELSGFQTLKIGHTRTYAHAHTHIHPDLDPGIGI